MINANLYLPIFANVSRMYNSEDNNVSSVIFVYDDI